MLGLIGRKKGMTQAFDENGSVVPVTVLEAGPCTVVQKKTAEADGYDALQLGFCVSKPGRMSKPRRGHLEKRGLPLFVHLKEFRIDSVDGFEVGDELCVLGFKVGDKVDVRGITKGRGFQGVIKRHGKHGGPAAHGSDFHRRPGSIGMRTFPARVLKNTRLPGHMGDVAVTVRNLEVVGVRPEDNAMLVKGSVPGSIEGLLEITHAGIGIESRPELKRGKGKSESSEGTGEGPVGSGVARGTAGETKE